jgi:hypothetical protein
MILNDQCSHLYNSQIIHITLVVLEYMPNHLPVARD